VYFNATDDALNKGEKLQQNGVTHVLHLRLFLGNKRCTYLDFSSVPFLAIVF